MVEQNLRLEEALKVLKETLNRLSNENVVKAILAWENNPFTADSTRNLLITNSKEKNIEIMLNKLQQRYDIYTATYITFLPAYQNDSIQLDDDCMTIVEELFEEFQLTNQTSEREKNRLQVESIGLNDEVQQSYCDFINERLVDFVEDDETIETLTSAIFIAVMLEMLYTELEPMGLEGLKKHLISTPRNEE